MEAIDLAVLRPKRADLAESKGGLETKGILPLAKSSLMEHGKVHSVDDVFLEVYGFGAQRYSGWVLPKHGVSYFDCGKWIKKGCLNVEAHVQEVLDEGVSSVGKAFVKLTKRSCGRFQCPICAEKAFSKEAYKIEHRLEAFHLKGRDLKVIHVVASPSKRDVWVLGFKDLRRKCVKILKAAGVYGGSIIFHPWRKLNEDDDLEKNSGAWYLSPHFHVLGYGWVNRVKDVYDAEGWVVKNLGVRRSVNSTAMYQLSHCGINDKHHSVSWFGALSYNRLRVPRIEVEKELCPLCGSKLRLLMQIKACEGLPELEGSYYVSADCFVPYPKSYG
jgi:hypothetical protein